MHFRSVGLPTTGCRTPAGVRRQIQWFKMVRDKQPETIYAVRWLKQSVHVQLFDREDCTVSIATEFSDSQDIGCWDHTQIRDPCTGPAYGVLNTPEHEWQVTMEHSSPRMLAPRPQSARTPYSRTGAANEWLADQTFVKLKRETKRNHRSLDQATFCIPERYAKPVKQMERGVCGCVSPSSVI
jgi:hypothetical protein